MTEPTPRPLATYPCALCNAPQQMAQHNYGPLVCGRCLETRGMVDCLAAVDAQRRQPARPTFGQEGRRHAAAD